MTRLLAIAGVLGSKIFVCQASYTINNTNPARISSSDSYTLLECNFIGLGSTSSSGGALYITGTNLSISYCFFEFCISSSGGGICFSGTNFMFNISCALSCCSSSEAQFMFTYSTVANISQIAYCRCSNNTFSGTRHSIDIRNSAQSLDNINGTNNYVTGGGSAAEIVLPSSFTLSYVNFVNCTKGDYLGVLILYSCITGTLAYGNIISNTGSTIVYGCSSYTFSYFIFANNSGTLFNSPTVIHSYINHTGTIGSVTTSDVSAISYPTITYKLQAFSCRILGILITESFTQVISNRGVPITVLSLAILTNLQ